MSEQRAPDPKRCPKCNRVAFRTMTDYLCVTGCGWHEHHDEPLLRDGGAPMTAPSPAWLTEHTAAVEAVLAEHDWRWAIRDSRTGDGVRIACTAEGCPWFAERDPDLGNSVWDEHRAHVAAAITAALAAEAEKGGAS